MFFALLEKRPEKMAMACDSKKTRDDDECLQLLWPRPLPATSQVEADAIVAATKMEIENLSSDSQELHLLELIAAALYIRKEGLLGLPRQSARTDEIAYIVAGQPLATAISSLTVPPDQLARHVLCSIELIFPQDCIPPPYVQCPALLLNLLKPFGLKTAINDLRFFLFCVREWPSLATAIIELPLEEGFDLAIAGKNGWAFWGAIDTNNIQLTLQLISRMTSQQLLQAVHADDYRGLNRLSGCPYTILGFACSRFSRCEDLDVFLKSVVKYDGSLVPINWLREEWNRAHSRHDNDYHEELYLVDNLHSLPISAEKNLQRLRLAESDALAWCNMAAPIIFRECMAALQIPPLWSILQGYCFDSSVLPTVRATLSRV